MIFYVLMIDNDDVDDDCNSHYVYIKNIAHLFSLCHNCVGDDLRYCPIVDGVHDGHDDYGF